jgi:3-deoxy-manno-octulosonate cytidylyltransferase (CMP-KDO synthetase)
MSAAEFYVAIPARFDSTRLPGKPLREISGRPMIALVYEQAVASGARAVVVATDDDRIRTVAEQAGAHVVMTRKDHLSGTDRIAEAASAMQWPDEAVIVNLQGDEPHMPPALLKQVANALSAEPQAGIATLSVPIREPSEFKDPNIVKVVCDSRGFALYFSRASIPWDRDGIADATGAAPALAKRHLGLYAYRAGVLRQFPTLPHSPLERIEHLEQLRALWHGVSIVVEDAASVPPPGIDTEADLLHVNA